MITNIYEKLPPRIRRIAPQRVKVFYARSSVALRKFMVYAHFWIKDRDIDEFFDNKKVFFILSIGRSGTKWLADILSKSPRAYVVHEPFIEAIPHQEAFNDPRKAEEYILKFRKKEIYLRVHTLDIDIYGEVNSFLRRHREALKKAFPNATILHLVRDGRAVVRSMYSRETLMAGAYDTKYIRPKPGDRFFDKWDTMSRFEKLCWYWTVENQYLYECCNGRVIQFEKIIADYEYFRERVLEPLGLSIPKEVWEKEVQRSKNVSLQYKLPHWKEWDTWMKERFWEICGEVMRKLGYI